MRRTTFLLLVAIGSAWQLTAPQQLHAQSVKQVPKARVPRGMDPRRAAEIQRMMELRALQNRSGGGPTRGSAPIILNGGPAYGAPTTAPTTGGEAPATTKKTSAQRRAEVRAKREERKQQMRALAAERKAEQAEKAKQKKEAAAEAARAKVAAP